MTVQTIEVRLLTVKELSCITSVDYKYEGMMTERQVIDKLSPIFFPITDVDRFFSTTLV